MKHLLVMIRRLCIKPDYADAYSNRGMFYRDLNRFDEALASYDQAIAINPNHAGAYSNRGNVFTRPQSI